MSLLILSAELWYYFCLIPFSQMFTLWSCKFPFSEFPFFFFLVFFSNIPTISLVSGPYEKRFENSKFKKKQLGGSQGYIQRKHTNNWLWLDENSMNIMKSSKYHEKNYTRTTSLKAFWWLFLLTNVHSYPNPLFVLVGFEHWVFGYSSF